MHSIYTKILLWALLTLLVALAGFVGTSYYLAHSRPPESFGPRLTTFQLEEARQAYETGGREKAAAYIERLDRYFRAEHHLLDASGRDLITGEDRSGQMTELRQSPRFPFSRPQAFRIVRASDDQKYRFLVIIRPRTTNFTATLPYYLWILGAVGLVCYVLAFRLVSPLRRLDQTVDRFGRGDLSVRLNWKRKDEFGELGRAFDRMADRIVTLLSAERRLLQDVSHELRSPLARLGFAVELARTTANRDAAFERIRKEVDRLTQLVNELLELTQSEGDPAAREMREVSVDAVLREIVDDCQMEAQAQGCRIALEADEPVTLFGDAKLIRRAVENVLRNAIRHAPQDSAVNVRLQRRNSVAAISVRDFGPGVPNELLSEIFKPFVRAESDRSRNNGGVGLGLSITQRAVHIHNGKVWAENANPGLAVIMEFPASEPARIPDAVEPARQKFTS